MNVVITISITCSVNARGSRFYLPHLALLVEGRTEEEQVGRLLKAPLKGVLCSSESSLKPDWIRALAANRPVLRMHIL